MLGKESMQELRLRLKAPPELNTSQGVRWLSRDITEEDLKFCINTASRYSPWATTTVAQGYITAPGGHRIGLCGEVVCRDREVTSIRVVHSINIRVARDFPGIANTIVGNGSVLILGAPGWGKTTLLRDLARKIAERENVTVVDERGELFPFGFDRGRRMDVLTGCPKEAGIDMALRCMGPEWIAVDEITAQADALALLGCVGCGVRLLATAHASSIADFQSRLVYRPLIDHRAFQTVLIMNRNKTFYTERTSL